MLNDLSIKLYLDLNEMIIKETLNENNQDKINFLLIRKAAIIAEIMTISYGAVGYKTICELRLVEPYLQHVIDQYYKMNKKK